MFVLLSLAVVAPTRAATPSSKDLVKAQLLADVSSTAPGQPFHVGALIKIEPGWHVYWKNPGDSGSPTKLLLRIPEDWSVSSVEYPIPTHHEDNAGITYNYEGEVMLIAELTPPKNAPAGPVEIGATVRFLVCQNVCLPGNAEVKLSLPVNSDQPQRANQEIFDHWMKLLPHQPKNQPKIQLTRSASATDPAWLGSIELATPQSVTAADWFPGRTDKLAFTEIRPTVSGQNISIHFKAAPRKPKDSPGVVDSVVAYTLPDGTRLGVSVPLLFDAYEK
jgi:thiol:disulfide interchange protein DsbD